MSLYGRGQPNMTFTVTDRFMRNAFDRPMSPLSSDVLAVNAHNLDRPSGEAADPGCDLLRSLHLWDAKNEGWQDDKSHNDIIIATGRFRTSRAGKPVFEMCRAEEATHIYIADNRDKGDCGPRPDGHTDHGDAAYFHGNDGHEYWVIPTDWSGYDGGTPIPDALARLQDDIDARETKNEKDYAVFLERQEKIAAEREEGEKVLEREAAPLLEAIRALDPDFTYEETDDGGIRVGNAGYADTTWNDKADPEKIIGRLRENLDWLNERDHEKKDRHGGRDRCGRI